MHATDCSTSEPYPTFPYRPRPKARKRSPELQQESFIRELVDSFGWPNSLGAIRRVTMVVAPIMCLVAAPSVLFESSAYAQTASSPSIDRFDNFVTEASTRFAVPALWIRAIIEIESAGDEHAISPRGAMGLMQLMPRTWLEISARYGLSLDPFDPRANILGGTAYLKEMHDRFGSAGFLAAYHAGPARYQQHLATGQPLRRKPPATSQQ